MVLIRVVVVVLQERLLISSLVCASRGRGFSGAVFRRRAGVAHSCKCVQMVVREGDEANWWRFI